LRAPIDRNIAVECNTARKRLWQLVRNLRAVETETRRTRHDRADADVRQVVSAFSIISRRVWLGLSYRISPRLTKGGFQALPQIIKDAAMSPLAFRSVSFGSAGNHRGPVFRESGRQTPTCFKQQRRSLSKCPQNSSERRLSSVCHSKRSSADLRPTSVHGCKNSAVFSSIERGV
jgi:hypothetical protein